MKIKQKGALALVIALLELSFLPIFLGVAGHAVGTLQLLFYTFLIAALVSVPVAVVVDKEGFKTLLTSGKGLLIIGIAGLCNNAISQILLTIGTLGTNPSIAAIVFRSWVLFSALLIPIVLRNKVSKGQLVAILVGFIGLYIVLSSGALTSLNAHDFPYLLMLLACALVYTVSVLLMRFYNASTTAAVALFNIVSVVFIGATALALNTPIAIPVSLQSMGIILFLGVVTYGVGTTLYFTAYKTLNPVFVGNVTLAVPFLTIIFSALLIGTPIEPYYIYSTAIIAGAVLIQQRLSRRATERINSSANLRDLQIFDVTSAFINNKKIVQQIRADNRALAIKLSNGKYTMANLQTLLSGGEALFFTNDAPHESISPDELDFINEIIAPQKNETVLIGIGKASSIENAFDQFVRAQSLS